MRNRNGKIIIAIAIIHNIFGFIIFYDIFTELVRESLFNTVMDQFDRNAAFWFVFSGFALMIIGGLINWIEGNQFELPPFLKWSFLAITIIGCFIMPISGFWLLSIPTIGLFLHRDIDK